MFFFYSLLLSFGFLLMSPLFLLRREKYASGFSQRLGNYPEFKHDGRKVIWLHCVSVGETNAARPLVAAMRAEFPDHRLVISTTTRTGQELAKKILADDADAIVYFPFDFKFAVRRALANFKPSLVLLMETEIWPRFIHEAKLSGAKVAIVNGRLSERSLGRYLRANAFVRRVLGGVDRALMQNEIDRERIKKLGMPAERIAVTGNLKFDQPDAEEDRKLAEEFRKRFGIDGRKPLIVAASTHEPEESKLIDAIAEIEEPFRLVIAPRHPHRFDDVFARVESSGYSFARRSDEPSSSDAGADIVLLDSIGELRSIYELADIVFVGGSLIPHGGQSVLEPAAAGTAILTGPYTHNFAAIVETFRSHEAIIQLGPGDERDVFMRLRTELAGLLSDPDKRKRLGQNAIATFRGSRGATQNTIAQIDDLLSEQTES